MKVLCDSIVHHTFGCDSGTGYSILEELSVHNTCKFSMKTNEIGLRSLPWPTFVQALFCVRCTGASLLPSSPPSMGIALRGAKKLLLALGRGFWQTGSGTDFSGASFLLTSCRFQSLSLRSDVCFGVQLALLLPCCLAEENPSSPCVSLHID